MKERMNPLHGLYKGVSAVLNKRGVLRAYIPRWVVLALDLSLVVIAYVVVLAVFRIVVGYQPAPGVELRILLMLFIYAVMELIFRIYRGTVRYSGISEMARLLLFVGASTTLGIFASGALEMRFDSFTVAPALLCVHGSLTFLLLFMLRIAVKYTFYFLSTAEMSRKRVLIYGCDANTLAMAQMLAADSQAEYKPAGLLDTEGTHKGMRLGSIPVYALPETECQVTDLMVKTRAEQIIFRDEQLKDISGELLDRLLATQVRLLVMGHTTDLKDRTKKARLSVNEIRIEDLLNREVIRTENSVVAEKHRDRVILVSGAAGSIGSEVVMQVAQFNPKQLILLDMAESPLYEIELKVRRAFPDLNVVIFIGDVRNKLRMETLFETYAPEVIYHAAAYKHVPMMERYPNEAIRINVMGTRILADLAVKYNTRKFVMVSTDKAVNPTNVMGASKRIAEIYVQSLFLSLAHLTAERKKRTRFITTRFGNVLGSNGSVVPLFKDQIAKGGPVTLTHKDIIRYFMTIPEACRLVLEAGCMGRGGEIFVFDMGEPVRIYDLAKRMIRLSGLTPGKDIEIIETGLRPGEKLFEELLNDKELTLPTHNDKIKVAKVREYDYAEVCGAVDALITLALDGDDMEVVRQMKRIVPEFKSRNSRFEELDGASEEKESALHEITH
ncbi:MAG: nucleoside-diphosphate sugar epimerase/dehydratase [Bacteroidales bacterium]